MVTGRPRRDGILWPTADLLLAMFGVASIAYPVAVGTQTLVTLPALTPGSLIAIVAFVGSYPFVAGHWPLGALGTTSCAG